MSDLSSRGLTSERVAIYARTIGTRPELMANLQRAIEDRGGIVVSAFQDNDEITGRGRYGAWRNLVASLNTVDQIVVADAAALPGRSVADLLKTLTSLRDCGVGLHLLDLDTGTTTCEVLDIIATFRRARLSQNIRAGQAKAVAAGRRIGRPPVPTRVHNAIQDALISGGGIRPTARKFNVSPAFVVNVRRAISDAPCTSY